MKIRPGRSRSLIAAIVTLIVTIVGLLLIPGPSFGGGFPGMGPGFGLFRILWLIVGLVAAGASFYNAFSAKGLPLYEIDSDQQTNQGQDRGTGGPSAEHGYCPNCGNPVRHSDRFCRHCGTAL
jgi:hypothetical protein